MSKKEKKAKKAEKEDVKELKKLKKMEEKAEKPAVIFRFDGTLMDTTPAVLASWHHMFDKYAPDVNFSDEIRMMALTASTEQMVQSYFPKKNTKKLVDEFHVYQKEHMHDLIEPMDGALKLLKWLKENDFATGVVSHRNEEEIVSILKEDGLYPYLDAVIGYYESDADNFHADSVMRAARQLKRRSVIYIGDNAARLMSARYTGCFTIGIMSSPYARTEDMIEAGADFITSDFKEVRKLLKGEALWLAYAEPETTEHVEEEKPKKDKKEKKSKKDKEKKKDKKEKKDKDKKHKKAKKDKKDRKK